MAFLTKSLAEIDMIELIVEIIKMTTISKQELHSRIKFKNAALLESYFQNGESVLICSAHYGNWEWGTLAMGLAFSTQNFPIHTR